MIDSYPWPASSWVPTYAISFWGSLGFHSHMKYVIHTFITLLYCKIQSIHSSSSFIRFHFISEGQPCDIGCTSTTYLMHTTGSSVIGVSALAHRGSFPPGGIPRCHAFPLCPLPSAVNTGGEAILLPWEVSLRKRGSALVLSQRDLG